MDKITSKKLKSLSKSAGKSNFGISEVILERVYTSYTTVVIKLSYFLCDVHKSSCFKWCTIWMITSQANVSSLDASKFWTLIWARKQAYPACNESWFGSENSGKSSSQCGFGMLLSIYHLCSITGVRAHRCCHENILSFNCASMCPRTD